MNLFLFITTISIIIILIATSEDLGEEDALHKLDFYKKYMEHVERNRLLTYNHTELININQFSSPYYDINNYSEEEFHRRVFEQSNRIYQEYQVQLNDEEYTPEIEFNNKSKELFISKLNEKQRESFENNQYIDIPSKKLDDIFYRIHTNNTLKNIDIYLYNRKISSVCYIMDESDRKFPLHDHLLAQKLWLESNEEEIIKRGNI